MVNIITPNSPATFNQRIALAASEPTKPMTANAPDVSSFSPIPKKADNNKTKIILASLGLVAFIGLASLAVLISSRQRDVKGPVAPNAPESKPEAYIEKPRTCTLTFQIPVTCNSICLQKSDCEAVNPNWDCIKAIEVEHVGGIDDQASTIKIDRCGGPDDLSCPAGYYCFQPPMPECPSGQGCSEIMPAKYCAPNPPIGSKRCRLISNPTSETCTPVDEPTPTITPTGVQPTPTITPTGVQPSPTITPTGVQPTPTVTPIDEPTPTVTPVDEPTPTLPPGITVNPTTPGTPPTYTVVTTVSCNYDCSRNSDCSNISHICYNGKCRLDVNPEDTRCILPSGETTVVVNTIPVRVPAPVELVKAGPADWGNYLKVGFGALGIGALLLLFL